MLDMATRVRLLDTSAANSQIIELDNLIRAGDITAARKILSELERPRVPREFLLPFSALARRVELPELALTLLNPIVRSSKPLSEPATDDEKAEYAASLVKIGAHPEAISLLEDLNTAECPSALLYHAFALIAVWDYAGASQILRKFLDHAKAEPYWRTVARVNLASCLVSERECAEAGAIIDDLLMQTENEKLTLLNGHLHELKAQNFIQQKDYAGARGFLEVAEKKLAKTDSRFSVFVTKWKAVADLLEQGATPTGLQVLSRVRAEAASKTHWETVRDCDRIRALLTHDQALATRIFFGTPFSSFRAKLKSDWGERLELPGLYEWSEGKVSSKHKILDLAGGSELKDGSVLHKLISALSSDFYRPFRLAAIFSAVYPEEFFNPTSSVLKVHQIINRLRKWLAAENLPIKVEEAQAFYRLVLSENATVRLRNPDQASGDPLFERLAGMFAATGQCNTQQVADTLEVSSSSALRLIKRWLEEGKLLKQGAGKQIVYSLVTTSTTRRVA